MPNISDQRASAFTRGGGRVGSGVAVVIGAARIGDLSPVPDRPGGQRVDGLGE